MPTEDASRHDEDAYEAGPTDPLSFGDESYDAQVPVQTGAAAASSEAALRNQHTPAHEVRTHFQLGHDTTPEHESLQATISGTTYPAYDPRPHGIAPTPSESDAQHAPTSMVSTRWPAPCPRTLIRDSPGG